MVRRRGDERGLATLLFTDIVGSTEVATELGDYRWHQLQARHHAVVRKQLKRFGGHEVDTAGDGFFITFPSPARGVRCAFAVVREIRELGLEVRAGLHIGEAQLTGEKVGGIAVTTAARVSAAAGPGQVFATDTIVHMVTAPGSSSRTSAPASSRVSPGDGSSSASTGSMASQSGRRSIPRMRPNTDCARPRWSRCPIARGSRGGQRSPRPWPPF